MDDDTATALREMVDLAERFPGAFRPEFELGHTAADALRTAAHEARTRVP